MGWLQIRVVSISLEVADEVNRTSAATAGSKALIALDAILLSDILEFAV